MDICTVLVDKTEVFVALCSVGCAPMWKSTGMCVSDIQSSRSFARARLGPRTTVPTITGCVRNDVCAHMCGRVCVYERVRVPCGRACKQVRVLCLSVRATACACVLAGGRACVRACVRVLAQCLHVLAHVRTFQFARTRQSSCMAYTYLTVDDTSSINNKDR